MTATGTIIRQLAERYQSLGLVAIPIRQGQPLVSWNPFQERPPAPKDTEGWPWDKADGLAIICGHRGMSGGYWWVWDVEAQHVAKAEAWLDAEHPGWRKGVAAKSQRGGLHLYLLSRRPVTTGKHPWGDIKGYGGLAYAPPTKRYKPDAVGDYEWLSFDPDEALELEPADLPWPEENGHHYEPLGETLKRTIPVGIRNIVLTRVAGWLRGDGQLEPDEVLAVLRLINRRCEEPLPDEELEDIARSAGKWPPNPLLITGNGHRPVTDHAPWDSDDPEAIAVLRLPEPPKRGWLLADLVPKQTVTTWFGDDGTGKSILATALALSIVTGRRFLDRDVEQGVVLYVDTEFDQDEFVRRCHQLLRGMGFTSVPDEVADNLRYYRTRHSLTTVAGQAAIVRLVERYQPSLVVVDSLTLGTYTDDLKEAAAAVTLMEFLGRLPVTVLALDHIPKPAPGGSQAYARPWGSFAKRAKARHAVLVTPSEAGGVVLRVTKTNVARKGAMVGADIAFEGDAIRVTAVELDSDALAGIEHHLPPLEQVYRALCQQEAMTPDALAEETGLAVGTVKNKLTALRRQGRAAPLGDGRWLAVRSPSLVTHSRDSDDDPPASSHQPSSLVTHSSDSDSDDGDGKPDIAHAQAKIGGHGPDTLSRIDSRKPDIHDGDAEIPRCEGCGQPLTQIGRRPPRWCSDACRKRAQRQREEVDPVDVSVAKPLSGPSVTSLSDAEVIAYCRELYQSGRYPAEVELEAGKRVPDARRFLEVNLADSGLGGYCGNTARQLLREFLAALTGVSVTKPLSGPPDQSLEGAPRP